MRADPDVSIVSFGFRIDPIQVPMMRCEVGGAWCSDEKIALVDQRFAEVEFPDRIDVWEQIQELMYVDETDARRRRAIRHYFPASTSTMGAQDSMFLSVKT